MNLIFLIAGSFLSVAFIIAMMRGKQYDEMLAPLEAETFPLKSIYSAGLAITNTKLGKMQGKSADSLRKSTTLMYEKKYAEYYAQMIWAQVISFVWITLAIGFDLAGLMTDQTGILLFGVGAIVVAAVFGYYFYTFTKSKVDTRKTDCEVEFPNALSKLALLVNSGMILHNAWETVAYGKDGVLYELMQRTCEDMNNGKSETDAMREFGILSDSDEIKKFTTALIQDLERGGGGLPLFLANEASEMWSMKRQRLLQKGEKASSALIAPIGLMFVGVILIIIVAAVQSMSF